MPYTIKKFNGQTLVTIQDGSVDSVTTDLNLPGKNYAGYGKALNESLIYLLENFANAIEPPNKVTGQLWFDTSTKKIRVFNGVSFKPLATVEHGLTAPSDQLIGDIWFNTTTNQLFVYDGTTNKLIGPALTNPSAAQLINKKVIDTLGNQHTILQAVFEDATMAIFSRDEFDINTLQTPVTGYSKVYKGITLPSRGLYPNVKFGGIARATENLLVSGVEIPASNFVQNTGSGNQVMTTSLSLRVEPTINSQTGAFTSLRGLFLGGSDNFYLGYNAGTGYINNLSGSQIVLNVTNLGSLTPVVSVSSLGVTPSADSAFDLGDATSHRWKFIYANNFIAKDNPNLASGNSGFVGKLTGNVVGNVNGDLTGSLIGGIKRITSTSPLTYEDILTPGNVSNGAPAEFKGNVRNGSLYGSVINASASDPTQQIAVDVSGTTTVFRGSFVGTSSTASALLESGQARTAFAKAVGATPSVTITSTSYNNTVAVRDASGNLYANRFAGLATSAEAIIDTNTNTAYAGSVGNVPYTVVIRDANGEINVGAITGTTSNALKLNGLTSSSENTPSTIVARDAGGNVKGTFFYGTATSAQYADLAEKYLADAEYEVGTVMMVGGDAEVTASKWGKRAIGAVSANPAYLMNRDLEGGTVIALKGRIPVKVIGSIKKGDDLIASDNGYAVMAVPHASRVFAVALESNDDTGVKLVECLIL